MLDMADPPATKGISALVEVVLFADAAFQGWVWSHISSKTMGEVMNQGESETMESTLFDKTFRDDEGNIAIAQKPNLPILVWLGATLVKLLPINSNLYAGVDALAFGAMFTWAWLELFQGVNYFRRSLGLIVLLGAIASRLQWW